MAIFTGTVSAADLNVINENGIQAGVDGASVNDTNSTTVTLMATASSDPGVQSVAADAVDTTGPVVLSSDPANNAVNVPSNKTITVTFNENICNGTGWIELKNSNGTVIPTNLSFNGGVLTVMPLNSLAEDRYSFCIHTGSVTDLAGNLVAISVSYFITGVSPLISTIGPVDGATNITLDKIITVTFNEPVQIGSGFIELYNSTNTSITVPITTSINGNVLTITHSGLLVNGTRYFLFLHTGCVTDLAGNPLTPILKSFTTSNDGTAPTTTSRDPANNAVNVPSNKTITVTFNENIRNRTGWIELKNSNGNVMPINLSINGNMLTVTPINPLIEDKYTVLIHTGSVTDLAGNPVAGIPSYFSVGNPPIVTVNHETGVYSTTQTIILNATDDFDSNPAIYYTTNGTTPTTSSTIYTNPITISTITTLKFMAVDNAGNQATVTTETYYFSIQDAINDAPINDTILVNNGTYTENIVINKQITLKAVSDGTVTIQALDLSNPVIIINSNGSGSTIQGFNITGNYYGNGIYIDNASNCTFTGNTIFENVIGIYLNSASNNTFTENNITNNYNYDMYFANASNNTFTGNNLGYCILYHSPENTLRSNAMNGIEIEGSDIFEYTEDIDTSNTINGDPVYYLINQSGLVFNGTNIGYLILINCDNITITNVNIDSYGTLFILNTTNSIIQNISRSTFYLYNSSNNTLSGIEASQVTLESSNYNAILGSSIYGYSWNNAIQLLNSSYNIITGNYVTVRSPEAVALSFSTDYSENENTNNAIYLELSSNNLISENTISSTDTGIYLESSPDNTISENNLIYCDDYGIYLNLSPNNTITGNNMTDCYGYNINLNSSANNTISNNYIVVMAISNSIGIALSNTSNCTINGNTITGDSSFNAMDTSESITNYGINLVSSTNNLIEYNTLTNNWLAIGLSADNNTFQYNNITGNFYGMLLYYSFNDTIHGNNIIGNIYGINTQESIVTIEFNRIIDNTINGLIHQSDICHYTITAINNWWGSNSAPSYSASETGAANCDINNWGGTVTHDTWFVLTINSSSNILVHDTSCTITAYLIYNNQGIDTSASGTVLDGIPITFSSNLGTFTSPVSTEDGVATTTLMPAQNPVLLPFMPV